MIRFGPAGNAESFTAKGYKSSLDVPVYLREMGLDAYEYQCGRGVRVKDDFCAGLRARAQEHGVRVSLHAPYYISMSGTEEEKRLKSVEYILQSADAVKKMGGERIVVHAGSCGKISREQALSLARDTLSLALAALDEAGFGDVHVCPEVMGKTGQLGTLEEVLALCALDERLIPCIDFGHLNARTFGGLKTEEDFAAVFDTLENTLGTQRAGALHVHFSRIEFTNPGGEKRHWTLADTQHGPDFEPLARVLVKRNTHATIICESAGTQSEDAAQMRDILQRTREELQ